MMMRNLRILFFLPIVLQVTSCKKDTPVNADFTFSPEGGQGPLEVEMTNNTTGADSYLWTFEGGDPATSTEASPTVVYYNRGTYSITLEASGDETKTVTKTITVDSTIRDMLLAKKWNMVYYVYVDSSGKSYDLYSRLADWGQDDYYEFYNNNTFDDNEGETKANPSDPQVIYTGTWKMNKMQDEITLDYVFYGDSVTQSWEKIKIEDDTLSFRRIRSNNYDIKKYVGFN